MLLHKDTIVALATPQGMGAIGLVRVSGTAALEMVSGIFSKDLRQAAGYSVHYGKIHKGDYVLDEAIATVFRAPRSYTREDVVELSCHGSPYILHELIQYLIEAGARPAEPGEYTRRAYLNGALDLAQAEAVADLIASTSSASHRVAMNQLRGGVSRELAGLRERLLNFTSLIELELDFGEEDVEFADRRQLAELVDHIARQLDGLIGSFRLGNALKRGVPTVILGKPNAGKSTLLNTLLNDNRAIVSEIPGTTRDVIEDRILIGGVEFRLMDTAGVRETQDLIEAEGVSRSLALAHKADILIYLFDATRETPPEAMAYVAGLGLPDTLQIIVVGNKLDLITDWDAYVAQHDHDTLAYSVPLRQAPWILISAQAGKGIELLHKVLLDAVESLSERHSDQTLISNARHLYALQTARQALEEVRQALEAGLSGDLLSTDIRAVLHHIGSITGDISTEEILGNIFSKFCIGK